MRFQVDRDVLVDAVTWAARALPARPAVPVLTGMKLGVGDDGLVLSAFDYEVSAHTTVPVTEVAEPGSNVVPGRLLADIVKSLPTRPVTVHSDGARTALSCGSVRFSLMTLPQEEYPELPVLPPLAGTVGSDTFATAVGQVAVAAGRDDTLPALTGIRVELDGDTLTFVATDRYRLAVREAHWRPVVDDLNLAVLVPARTLLDTARALTSVPEVSIALNPPRPAGDDGRGGTDSGVIGFAGGDRRATTRLLGGDYPRYQSLLPAQFDAAAELSVATFTEAVKRVALVTQRGSAVRLSFGAGRVVLEAGSGDDAQAREEIEVSFDGDDLEIAFNPSYLLDGIAALGCDTARMSFTSPTRPAVITGTVGGDGDGADPAGADPAGGGAGTKATGDYRYVLMPIRGAG